jgi:hypothetical protein
MSLPKIKATLLASILTLASAVSGHSATRSVSESFATAGARGVAIHFPVGDLSIEAADVDAVQATLIAHCRFGGKGCERRTERLRLVSKRRGERLDLKLEGYPRFDLGGLQVELRLLVPRSFRIEVHMGVGAAELRGLDRDVEVHMGVGDVEIHAPGQSVGSVQAHVGIGDAQLSHDGRRIDGSGFIAQKLRWNEGAGRGRVEVHLGIGSVDVALR